MLQPPADASTSSMQAATDIQQIWASLASRVVHSRYSSCRYYRVAGNCQCSHICRELSNFEHHQTARGIEDLCLLRRPVCIHLPMTRGSVTLNFGLASKMHQKHLHPLAVKGLRVHTELHAAPRDAHPTLDLPHFQLCIGAWCCSLKFDI